MTPNPITVTPTPVVGASFDAAGEGASFPVIDKKGQ
jgi:hypothetical protein